MFSSIERAKIGLLYFFNRYYLTNTRIKKAYPLTHSLKKHSGLLKEGIGYPVYPVQTS
jgi:hypothetical protein